MPDIDSALDALDLDLFAAIESQTSDDDKRSLLACQAAVRRLVGTYRYLEIGSHLGGSIQPHLLDDSCIAITSIDKRPPFQPDERGVDFVYSSNSTRRMLDNLAAIQSDLSKLTTIDDETSGVAPASVDGPIRLCFIDGEHTDDAVIGDFGFCLDVIDDRAAIVFHDAPIVYNGLQRCVDTLHERGISFHAYALPSAVFVIEIGDLPLHADRAIAPLLVDNHTAYLGALQANDHYRRFYTQPAFRRARAALDRARSLTGTITDRFAPSRRR